MTAIENRKEHLRRERRELEYQTTYRDTRVPVFDEEGRLLCPACGERYLHLGAVELFVRNGEDAAEGMKVAVDTGGHLCGQPIGVKVTPKVGPDNPSARRDGVKLKFWCETCPYLSVVRIAEHEGVILVTHHASPDKEEGR